MSLETVVLTYQTAQCYNREVHSVTIHSGLVHGTLVPVV